MYQMGDFFFNHGEKFKDKVLIYLDARLINLYGDRLIQYLEKVQCETLEKIEIFFNPPAQFNVQGKNIGIINLVSKTSRQISSFLFKE